MTTTENRCGAFFRHILHELGAPREVVQDTERVIYPRIAGMPLVSYCYGRLSGYPIFVQPKLFKRYSAEEFSHILIEHEGRHVAQVVHGIQNIHSERFREDWIARRVGASTVAVMMEFDANMYALTRSLHVC